MITLIEAARFFLVVPPVPPRLIATLAVVTVASVAAVGIDPHLARGTMHAVFVLQLFGSSSGFAGPARRGHYDLLLTRGERRLMIAAIHWAFSVLPGVASWVAVAAAEAIAGGGSARIGFTSGTVAALFVVSTGAWATTVALPRFAGAIGWLVALVMTMALWPSGMPRPLLAIVYPLDMIGRSARAEPQLIVPSVVLGVAAMAAALVWVERSDVPLEAAQ